MPRNSAHTVAIAERVLPNSLSLRLRRSLLFVAYFFKLAAVKSVLTVAPHTLFDFTLWVTTLVKSERISNVKEITVQFWSWTRACLPILVSSTCLDLHKMLNFMPTNHRHFTRLRLRVSPNDNWWLKRIRFFWMPKSKLKRVCGEHSSHVERFISIGSGGCGIAVCRRKLSTRWKIQEQEIERESLVMRTWTWWPMKIWRRKVGFK